GGLAAAAARGALRYGVGARVVVDELCERDGLTPAQALFSESQGRVLLSVPRTEEQRFVDMVAARGVPCARVGVTDDEGTADDSATLQVQGQFEVPLSELRAAWQAPLAERFA